MRKAYGLLAFSLVALGLISFASGRGDRLAEADGSEAYSLTSFDKWLKSDTLHASSYSKLEQFLKETAVDQIVPVWQLTRTDSNRFKNCDRPEFLVPPEKDWKNIVPVLRFLGTEIIPVIGPVEVVSSYRTDAFNECVGGATRSKHLSFSALDLKPLQPIDNEELFRKLCAVQKKLGRSSKFGLGAYFDPQNPDKSSGRFHIDLSGYRSWGRSKASDSSGCRAFR